MKKMIQKHPVLSYILIAYLFSWSIELIAIAGMNGNYNLSRLFPYLLVAQFGPTVAAIVVVFFKEGKSGLKDLFRKLIIFRFPFKSYLFSLFTIPVILCLYYFALRIKIPPGPAPFLVYLTVLIAPLNGLLGPVIRGAGPLGEELGWRGFLLPRLLKKYNDVTASLLLGVVWTFWHLPVFLFPEWRDGVSLPAFFVLYPVSVILLAYFMTKVWRMTRGSVFIAIWIHGIINFCFSYLPNRKIWDLSQFSNVQVNLITIGGLLLCCIVIHFLSSWAYSDKTMSRIK